MKQRRSLEIDFMHNLVCPEFPLLETPFISSLDAEQEYLTIYNPANLEVSLAGYFVSDSKKLHRFTFSEDTVIEPLSQLHLYTCPAGNHNIGDFIEPYVLWTNSDGSLRKKEVLNNEHCSMQLHAPNGKCLATCTADNDGHPPRIQRRSEELHHLPPWQLNFSDRITCAVVRVCALGFMVASAFFRPHLFAAFYWIGTLLDVLGRSHGEPQREESRLLLLNAVGDKANVGCLYIAALAACGDHTDGWGLVTFWLLFASMVLELAGWDTTPYPNGDLFSAIRHHFSGAHASDFQRYGDLCVALICVGSEAALMMLFLRAKFSAPIEGVDGAALFDLLHRGALGLSCAALVLRQINNLARILLKLEMKMWK